MTSKKPPDPTPRPAPLFVVLPLLAFTAQVGTLARIFLADALVRMGVSTSPTAIVHGAILANVAGCAIFGASQALSGWSALRLVLLRSWFCGSLTSFSNWIQDANLKILRGEVGAASLTLVIGFSACYAAHLFGEQLGRWLYPAAAAAAVARARTPPTRPTASTTIELSHPVSVVVISPAAAAPAKEEEGALRGSFPMMLCAFACSAGLSALLLALAFADPPRRRRWLSALFGPFGCFVRYELSRRNNRTPTFPAMTFVANLFGSLIVAACFVILGEGGTDPRDFESWRGAALWTTVVADGICGCLSTFSSFVGEIKSLEAYPSWRYAFVSILASLGGVFIICGVNLLSHKRTVDMVLGL